MRHFLRSALLSASFVCPALCQVSVFEADFEASVAEDHATIANINAGTAQGHWIDLRQLAPSYNRIRTNSTSSNKAFLPDRVGRDTPDGFALEAWFAQPVSLTNATIVFDTAVGRTVGDPEKNYDIIGEDTNGVASFHLTVLGGTSPRQVGYNAPYIYNTPVPLATGAHLDPEVTSLNGNSAYNPASLSRLLITTTPTNWTVSFDKNKDGTPDWVSAGLPYVSNAISIARLRLKSQVKSNMESEAGAWLDNIRVTGIPFTGTVTNPPATNSPAAGTNWNVLMIAIDDLNDWIGALGGHPQTLTPNMDRLASRGAVFCHTQTAAPACQPSRSALMTGITPATSSLYQNGDDNFRLKDATRFATSLPQFLKNRGYRIGISGKIYHSPDMRESKPVGVPKGSTDWDLAFAAGLNLGEPGFNYNANTPGDKFAGLGISLLPGPYNNIPVPHAPYVVYDANTNVDKSPATLHAMREAMNDFRVARWIENQITNANTVTQPLFLAGGMTKPHLDWKVPINYFDKFDVETIQLPPIPPDDLADLSGTARGNGNPGDHTKLLSSSDPNAAWRHAVRAYLAAINFCDEAVGVMLDAVETRKATFPEEKWMVVLWSDHGWHLGEKQRWRKFTLWEESARSVLMFWVPGLTIPETRVDVPVSLMDIYPTVLDLLGMEVPSEQQGRSLVPLMKNPGLLSDSFPVMCDGEGWHTVRTKRWRYIRYSDGNEELYDHYRDPQEWFNLLHPLNASRIYDGQNVTNAHRRILTELAKWSVKVNSTALFSTPRGFDVATVPTLGKKRVDHFDAPLANWTLRTPGTAFSTTTGVLKAPAATTTRMTADGLSLAHNEDLFVSGRVNFAAQGGSAGVLFGWQDEDHFYELRVADGRGAGAGLDVQLFQRAGGMETNLIQVFDRTNVGTTNTEPPIQAGWFTVTADYSAANQSVELWIARPDGAPYWRGEYKLPSPLPLGSECGLVVRGATDIEMEDFFAFAYVPFDIAAPDRIAAGGASVQNQTFRFNWPSTPDAKYRVWSRPDLQSPWAVISSNVLASPPTNEYVHPAIALPSSFFKVEEE